MRLALGGSRWRLARLLFVESLLVAMTGAALGLVFGAGFSGVDRRRAELADDD